MRQRLEIIGLFGGLTLESTSVPNGPEGRIPRTGDIVIATSTDGLPIHHSRATARSKSKYSFSCIQYLKSLALDSGKDCSICTCLGNDYAGPISPQCDSGLYDRICKDTLSVQCPNTSFLGRKRTTIRRQRDRSPSRKGSHTSSFSPWKEFHHQPLLSPPKRWCVTPSYKLLRTSMPLRPITNSKWRIYLY